MITSDMIARLYILWFPFGISYILFHSVSAVYFAYKVLGGQGVKNFIKPKHAGFVIAYAMTIFAENMIFKDILSAKCYFLTPVFILIVTAYAMVVLRAPLKKALPVSLMSNAIIILSLYLCGEMNTFLFGFNLFYLIYSNAYEHLFAVIASPVIVFYIMFIILRTSRKIDFSDKSSVFMWANVSVVLIISDIIVMELFVGYGVINHRAYLFKFMIFAVIYTVLTGIVVYWLLSDLVKKNKAVTDLALLRQTEEYNRQYIESLQNEYEIVRKLQHDYKNSFLALSALLEEGEIEKAREQISKNIGFMIETEIFINTDNAVVNAVANAKLSTAKSFGIECECLVAKDISGIDDSDLCRLLSNMLDNAITACKNEVVDKKRIELSIRSDSIGYMITVKNTISRSVLESNPGLKSTKENTHEHGYGVRIIHGICEKYGGRSDFYEEDEMFCCSTYLRKKDA